ncbi:hypothetical protein [Microbacterium rhizomatis]|nr:hypothetical protein [Microbacterium rhizomatis]
MTITLDRPPVSAAPALSPLTPARLVSVTESLWRVIDPRGIVIGHVQALSLGDSVRFRARRYHAASKGFRDLGDFWSADDAVDCLRFAR